MRDCEGLPSTGRRPLQPEELRQIRSSRWRLWRRAALSLLLFPGSIVALGAVALALRALSVPDAIVPWVLVPVGFLAFLIGLPIPILLVRDALRDAWALGGDLRAGIAEEFADEIRTIALLPRSEQVIRRSASVVAPSGRVLVGEAAPAAGEAVWAVPASAMPMALRGSEWARRPLGPDERAELDRRARDLRRFPLLYSAATVLAVVVAVLSIGEAHRAPAATAFRIVMWLVIFGYGWAHVLRRREAAARLARDAEGGWVARAVCGEVAGIEVLPASGLSWASGGAPAAWRLQASRGNRR